MVKDGLDEPFLGLDESGCIDHQILSVDGQVVRVESPLVVQMCKRT